MNGISMGTITSERTRPVWRDGMTPLWIDDEPVERHFGTAVPGVDYWGPPEGWIEEKLLSIRPRHEADLIRRRDPGPFWYRNERKIREYKVPVKNRDELRYNETSVDQPVWWDQIGG